MSPGALGLSASGFAWAIFHATHIKRNWNGKRPYDTTWSLNGLSRQSHTMYKLAGYTPMSRTMVASAPMRRVDGRSSKNATTSSTTPLTYVQNASDGGSHGGTMSLKKLGLAKCITPANPRKRPTTIAMRFQNELFMCSFENELQRRICRR